VQHVAIILLPKMSIDFGRDKTCMFTGPTMVRCSGIFFRW